VNTIKQREVCQQQDRRKEEKKSKMLKNAQKALPKIRFYGKLTVAGISHELLYAYYEHALCNLGAL